MLRDIKGPFALLDPLWVAALSLLLVMVAIAVVYFLKRKKKKPQVPVPPVPQRPYDESALEKLEACIELYRKEGNTKIYYSKVSDVVRDYLGHRYAIDALEKTTSEIFMEMRRNSIERKGSLEVKEILDFCDLVKFAKLSPPEKDAEEIYKKVKQFIEETRIKPEAVLASSTV